MTLDLDRITDPRLAAGFAYWNRVRGDRAMPSRRDIHPTEIVALLPHVFLVDVRPEPARFRIRLAGTAVVKRFGEEVTGRLLEELDLGDRSAAILATYAATVDGRAPTLFQEEYYRRNGRYMLYLRLLCPLSSDGQSVDMLFGMLADTGGGASAYE